MVIKKYVPKKGDFIIITFNPQSGREQKGRRPAFVVSNDLFNKHTGLAMVCPITNTNRHFPFHIPILKSRKLTGFIIVEQIKSIDYKTRNAKFIEKAHKKTLNEVLSILDAIVY